MTADGYFLVMHRILPSTPKTIKSPPAEGVLPSPQVSVASSVRTRRPHRIPILVIHGAMCFRDLGM